MGILRDFRTGKPNRERAARYMLYIGIGCLVFPVRGLCHFTYLWGILTGVFSIVSWYGLSRRLPWSFKLSYISMGMLVAALCAVYVEMAFFNPAGKWDFSKDTFGFFSGILLFLAFLQFTVPAVFFLYYLNRLERFVKNQAISDSIVTRVSESKEFSKPESPAPKIKYRYSRFGPLGEFSPMIAFVACIAICAFFVTAMGIFFNWFVWVMEKMDIYKDLGKNLLFLLIPFIVLVTIILVVIIILIVITVRRFRIVECPTTPFQKERKPLKIVEGEGRLFVYSDGIEFGNWFFAYFVPYDKIEKIELEKDIFYKFIVIRTDLPDVPATLRFDCKESEDVLSLIKKTMRQRLYDVGKTDRGDIERVITEMEKDERMEGEKSKTKSRQFRISVAIAAVQILIFFLAGPAAIGYKWLMRDSQTRTVKIMTKAEYLSNPLGIDVPCDFYLAEFVFDHNGTLQSGKYYCTLFGKTKKRVYKDGHSFEYGSPYDVHTKFFPVFMIISFCVALTGTFIKDCRIYGAVMFMTMWGLGIVWIFISSISDFS